VVSPRPGPAARLTEALAADPHLAGCTVLALPMATSSWGPVNQAAFLRREGSFGAVVAVMVVSAHDLYDLPRPDVDILPYRLARPWTAIGDAVQGLLERERRKTSPPDVRPLETRARISLAALGDMVARLRAAEVEPTLVYHPTTTEREGEVRREKAAFFDWARARGIGTLDLGAEINASGGYRDAIHPDADGAVRIARVLARAIRTDLPPC
jgi:hypothetical protein